jgi:hypothetical protein
MTLYFSLQMWTYLAHFVLSSSRMAKNTRLLCFRYGDFDLEFESAASLLIAVPRLHLTREARSGIGRLLWPP